MTAKSFFYFFTHKGEDIWCAQSSKHSNQMKQHTTSTVQNAKLVSN